jgi:glucokinase
MIVLAGDIGGTNTRLALVELDAVAAHIVREAKYSSHEFAGLAPVVRRFLRAGGPAPERACYGIAGPVIDQRCKTSNLPWIVDGSALALDTGIGSTLLINDFHAVGYGVQRLGTEDFVTLQSGETDSTGPIALIGAGTGLGQGFLFWDGARYRVHGSEGGHVAFAARNPLEWGLVAFLNAEFKRTSYERVLSGSGLAHLYRYLAASAPEAEGVHEEMEREDPAAVVSRHALAGTDSLCIKALDLFVTIYGRQAGHLAITVLATGGVFVAGGIAPRIVAKLTDGAFMAAFRDQGRLTSVAERVPVHVVLHPSVGLLGAAAAALTDLA